MGIDRVSLTVVARSIYGCAASLSYNHWELSLAVISFFLLLWGQQGYVSLFVNPLIAWIIATIICFFAARRLYTYCWGQCTKYSANADILIFVAAIIMYGYSIILMLVAWQSHRTVTSSELYFNTSVSLMTFMLLFDYMRGYFCIYSLRPLQNLMRLQSEMVTIWHDNEWRQVPVDQLTVGDRIQVTAGDYIPVDGLILNGAASIDEYELIGRKTMVFKDTGDRVLAGTVSMSGSFEMSVDKVGEHTLLAKIIKRLKQAEMTTISVADMVGKHESIFVLMGFLLAIFTFFIWFLVGPAPQWLYAIFVMSSVLSIVSVCAPLLALVMAIVAGIGYAAQMGMLIKNARVFDVARRIGIVVFDKTGTLTYGKYKVQAFELVSHVKEIFATLQWPVPSHLSPESYVKTIIHAVESRSDHAVARAVIDYLSEYQLLLKAAFKEQDIEGFEVLPGLGVRCFIQGHQVLIGSKKFLEQEKISVALALDGGSEMWVALAHTVSFVAFDNQLVVYFCVADSVREGVSEVIAQLKAQGIRTILITADDHVTANAIAQRVGIDQVLARVMPQDKADDVRKLESDSNLVVAMVGDGIQDASMLAAADVGIAFCSGMDNTAEPADIILLREDMALVPKIIAQSQTVMRTIYHILVIGLMYNSILIPMAMGIWYLLFGSILSPFYAGVTMVFFSVLFMLYAVRRHTITGE